MGTQAIPPTFLSPTANSWKVKARFLAGVWLLMVFVVATVYRSNLMAMLISPKVKLPFDSLEELGHTDITVWAPTGSLFHDAVNVSCDLRWKPVSA